MKKSFISTIILTFLVAVVLSGCGSNAEPKGPEQTTSPQVGVLQFKANGEDFVRAGFTSKDGWDITFDHVYINLAEVTAYQSEPPYDSEKGAEIQAEKRASLPGARTVDLAEGNEDAPPILVGEVKDAVVGHYNAISWKMARAAEGPNQGYSLVIVGKAVKGKETVNFTIKDEGEYSYAGGEYVGDQRKGILAAGGTADLEMTFHFDHIFGDADTPADDELNLGASGFNPFAALAEKGALDVDMAKLQQKLAPAEYQKLKEVLKTLGHVGEGHCHCNAL